MLSDGREGALEDVLDHSDAGPFDPNMILCEVYEKFRIERLAVGGEVWYNTDKYL